MAYHKLVILSRPRMIFKEKTLAEAILRAKRYYKNLKLRYIGETMYLSMNGKEIGYIEPIMVSKMVKDFKKKQRT